MQTGLILAVLEEPLTGNREDPLPSVTVLVRGPFGRHAWALQLRQQVSRDKSTAAGASAAVVTPERPRPRDLGGLGLREAEEAVALRRPKPRYFPEAVDKIDKTSA